MRRRQFHIHQLLSVCCGVVLAPRGKGLEVAIRDLFEIQEFLTGLKIRHKTSASLFPMCRNRLVKQIPWLGELPEGMEFVSQEKAWCWLEALTAKHGKLHWVSSISNEPC